MASKNLRFSQNRRFKRSPVNFRYHRTSVEKQKKIGHLIIPWLLDAKIRLSISRYEMAAVKQDGLLKKKLPNSRSLDSFNLSPK
jgi:hypothetical protein